MFASFCVFCFWVLNKNCKFTFLLCFLTSSSVFGFWVFAKLLGMFASLCVFDFFVLIWFLGSCLNIISGNNYSCFCKNDSGGFKKDLAS